MWSACQRARGACHQRLASVSVHRRTVGRIRAGRPCTRVSACRRLPLGHTVTSPDAVATSNSNDRQLGSKVSIWSADTATCGDSARRPMRRVRSPPPGRHAGRTGRRRAGPWGMCRRRTSAGDDPRCMTETVSCRTNATAVSPGSPRPRPGCITRTPDRSGILSRAVIAGGASSTPATVDLAT